VKQLNHHIPSFVVIKPHKHQQHIKWYFDIKEHQAYCYDHVNGQYGVHSLLICA